MTSCSAFSISVEGVGFPLETTSGFTSSSSATLSSAFGAGRFGTAAATAAATAAGPCKGSRACIFGERACTCGLRTRADWTGVATTL